MPLSASHTLLIITVCAICTFSERLLPFVIFGNRVLPPVVRYLGKILPVAVMATLVIYCLRHIELTSLEGFLPEIAAASLTAALHLIKKNTLLSVIGGTVCYMLLVQLIF